MLQNQDEVLNSALTYNWSSLTYFGVDDFMCDKSEPPETLMEFPTSCPTAIPRFTCDMPCFHEGVTPPARRLTLK